MNTILASSHSSPFPCLSLPARLINKHGSVCKCLWAHASLAPVHTDIHTRRTALQFKFGDAQRVGSSGGGGAQAAPSNTGTIAAKFHATTCTGMQHASHSGGSYGAAGSGGLKEGTLAGERSDFWRVSSGGRGGGGEGDEKKRARGKTGGGGDRGRQRELRAWACTLQLHSRMRGCVHVDLWLG